jgi:polyferredoxin
LDPLALIFGWMAAHEIVASMLLALITLGVTLLAGRWFCGWVCPMGTLHNAMTAWRKAPAKARLMVGGYSKWQKSKYYLLGGLLVAALLGLNLAGWFDPLSFLFRSMAIFVYPAANDGVKSAFTWIYQTDPGVGSLRLTKITEPVYEVLRRHVLASTQPHFYGSFLIALLFVVILFLNFYRARFWCRYVCPLGALLGLAAKNPLVRLKRNDQLCNDCRLCVCDCQGGANPDVAQGWKPSECFYCWNCHEVCPEHALSFHVEVPGATKATATFRWIRNFFGTPKPQRLDLKRRSLLFAGAAGAGMVLLARTSAQGEEREFNPALIRPPGSAGEEEFLSKCIRCGECMKVCPTNAIHPAMSEGGVAGLWTPVLKMKIGYCDYECTLCSQACPTHAIRQLLLEEKQKIHIGTAFIDRDRCLPYASAKSCIVCEEHCPTPKKAIWFQEVAVMAPDGSNKTVKQPHINPDLCIGCGICETKCPITDQRGVRVTSVGETRNLKNQIFLPEAHVGYGDS